MGKKWLKIFLPFGFLASLAVGGFVFSQQEGEGIAGISVPDAEWFIVNEFSGFNTKVDPSKVPDSAHVNGQNTIIRHSDRISIRDFGYEILPNTDVTTSTQERVTSLHTFRKRSGEQILMRTHGSFIDYYDASSTRWEVLKITTTTGREYGFADYNINTDLQSFVYFGDGENNFRRWTGAHTETSGTITAGATSIPVYDASEFPATGLIIYCDQEIIYTSRTNTSFTVGSANACAQNRGVALVPQDFPLNIKGNIYTVANNRLFIAGVTSTPQAVFFSEYGAAQNINPTLLISTSTSIRPGIFNLGEGGGGVTGMAFDENSIYIFKPSIIYRATLTDDLYTLTPLKPFDGRSQTTGALSQRAIFTGGNGIFFITPDNKIMSLSRVENVDYPQITPISDLIKPTIDKAVFTSSSGIFFKDKAYFSAKSSNAVNTVDTIFVWNQTVGAWESPVLGMPVSDWAVYDHDNDDREDLFWGHAVAADVNRITDTPLDDVFPVIANWRSKEFTFDAPAEQKEIEDVFVEGFIGENTTLNISLLLDENGFTNIQTAAVSGTEQDYLYEADAFNLFGFSPFGSERFGTNDETGNKKKFRVYLSRELKRIPFYTAQLEFASDGENEQWEVTRFGFRVRKHSQPIRTKLMRYFR